MYVIAKCLGILSIGMIFLQFCLHVNLGCDRIGTCVNHHHAHEKMSWITILKIIQNL